MLETTQAVTESSVLPAYEISNHARPGEESRHNLAYWRYQTYAGIGPGAHGRRGGAATQRHRKPENWLKALARNGHGLVEENVIAPADAALERLLMGLRLREGIVVEAVADVIDPKKVEQLEKQGLLAHEPGRLRTLPPGRLLLDGILAEIVRL